jgi:cytochrome c oxidase subunit III
MHASFDITDGIYGSIFYTLTGLHGAHVIIGVILLIIVFFRLVFKQYNFTFSPHIGITAAV